MTLATGSRNERFKQGKALRRETPREAHADLKGSLSRNAVAILAESDFPCWSGSAATSNTRGHRAAASCRASR